MTDTTSQPTRRRTVLFGAGALGTTAILAGCGDDDKPADDASTPGATTTAPAEPTPGASAALAKAAEVPVGSGLIVAPSQVVVTQPEAGTFKGFSAKCTHQGCIVSDIKDGMIHCGCHNSLFSIKDGSVQGGPAKAPLPPVAVKQQGTEIVKA